MSSCLSWPSRARPRLSLLSASVGFREKTLLRVNPGDTPILPVQSFYFPFRHVTIPFDIYRVSLCISTHLSLILIETVLCSASLLSFTFTESCTSNSAIDHFRRKTNVRVNFCSSIVISKWEILYFKIYFTMDTIRLEIRISPIRDTQKPVQGIVDTNYHMRYKFPLKFIRTQCNLYLLASASIDLE